MRKPIQGSCAIYFPGGIDRNDEIMGFVLGGAGTMSLLKLEFRKENEAKGKLFPVWPLGQQTKYQRTQQLNSEHFIELTNSQTCFTWFT